MDLFVQRYGSIVTGIVNGFDRLVFRGTLRSVVQGTRMMAYLSRVDVLIKDFSAWVQTRRDRITGTAATAAKAAGRPEHFLNSSAISKEDLVRGIQQRDGIGEGLITVLRCTEPCQSFEVYRDAQTRHIRLESRRRMCQHVYWYLMHPRYGFMHVRLQTWAPYDLRVSINGREWLARQLDAAGIGYRRRDNCFTRIDDVAAANNLLQQQLREDWSTVLDGLARQVNPNYTPDFERLGLHYYWSVYQSEWASDVMFRSPAELARRYPRLVRHGITQFGSGDVMRFLARRVCADGRVNPRFHGDLLSDLRTRVEGVRLKHRVDANTLKMYDKFASVLRVETTINDPKDFKVYRPKPTDPSQTPDWLPLRKTVADLPRRAEVSQNANQRYLDALAAVEDTTPLKELTNPVCRPTRWKKQRVRALNPLAPDDAALLAAVARGEFLIHGFRNRDLCPLLYPKPAANPDEQRRRSAAITRRIRILRAHRLIRKVTGSHRYRVSAYGRKVLTALLAAQAASTEQLTAIAA